jgi:hypothetical protein
MSNMSYCRFHNTLADLLDCEDALSEMLDLSELSVAEQKSAKRLIQVCRRIADNCEDMA